MWGPREERTVTNPNRKASSRERTRVYLTDTDGTVREVDVVSREVAERLAKSAAAEDLARIAWREAFPNMATDIDGLAVVDLRTGEVRGSSVVAAQPDVPGFGHLVTLHRCPAETREVFESKEPSPAQAEEAYLRAVARVGPSSDPDALGRELDAVYGRRG